MSGKTRKTALWLAWIMVWAGWGAAPSAQAGPAGRCSSIRLPVEERLGPPRDDTGSNWCYAYLSADLLSWKLGKRISAADIALTFNDGMELRKEGLAHSEVDTGGLVEAAIRFTLHKGACTEADMPSQDFLVLRSNGMGEELELKKLLREIEEHRRSWSHRPSECVDMEPIQAIFPWMNLERTLEVLRHSNEWNYVSRLQEKNCAGRRIRPKSGLQVVRVSGPMAQALSTPGQEQLFTRIDRELEAGEIVGLAISGNFFRDRNITGGGHALSVVGRRLREGKCEYLLRNSWGPNCDGLPNCENGSHWASVDELKGMMLELYLLK